MSYSYSQDSEMSRFLSLKDDSETYEQAMAKIGECGYDDLWVDVQIDWAIDDKENGWHYTPYWDTMGYETDEYGNLASTPRVSCWDVASGGVNGDITHNTWILRAPFASSDFESKKIDGVDNYDYYVWNGSAEGQEPYGYILGLKSQLQDGKYTIESDSDGNKYIKIDYSAHTVYTRARFAVTVRKDEQPDKYYFSDWSEIAGYGKDAPAWQPYTQASLAAPAVSNLKLTDEKFNGDPVVSYTLTVPDALQKGITEVQARGGEIRIETEMRAKGTDTWKLMQGDFVVHDGTMRVDLHGLPGEGRMIPDGTELEFRCRFWCNQYSSWNGEYLGEFWSAYSNILTVKTTQVGSGTSIFANNSSTSSGQDSTTGQSTEAKISSLNSGASYTQVSNYVTGLKNDNDPKGSSFGFLFAKQKKVKKNAIALTWKKPKNASYYVIYGAKCGRTNPYQQLTSVKKTTYTQSALKKGTYYKYLVAAFDKNDKLLGVSNTLHIATKGGKVCNFKKVTTAAKKNKVTLKKKGKTFKLKGKATKESKKLKVDVHRKIHYESSNKKVATVNSSGKVTAKKKGSCYIYAYAQNGVYQKVKVTVKK